MNQFRIRLYGVNNLEQASFRSLLNIAESKLEDHWEITQAAHTDVAIYDIQSEIGKTAFHRHHSGISVVLTDDKDSIKATSILVKPLRVKRITELLNRLGKEIHFNNQAAKTISSQKGSAQNQKKPGLLSSFSKHFISNHDTAIELPSLSLSVNKPSSNPPHTILEPNKLHSWLRSIAKNSLKQRALTLYTNLVSLNKTVVKLETKIALLEHYRHAIIELITPTDRTFLQLNTLSDLALPVLMTELAMGYKSLLMNNYHNEKHPMSNPLTLLYIIRTAEFFNLAILSAYCRYQAPPTNILAEFHHLYRYCEAADMLTDCAHSAIASTEKSFIHHYTHILVLAHTHPYRLATHKTLRLYDIFSHLLGHTVIGSSRSRTDTTMSVIQESDPDNPRPIQYTTEADQQQKNSRFIHLEPLIVKISEFVTTPEKKPDYFERGDIELLNSILPYFSQAPIQDFLLPPKKEPQFVSVTTAFEAIVEALSTPNQETLSSWYFIKQQQETLYLQRYSAYEKAIQAGQLLLIYQQERTVLASILWVYTDHSHTMHLAAQLITQQPHLVTIVDRQNQQPFSAISYPLINSTNAAGLIIDNKQSLDKALEYQLHSQDNTTTFISDKTISHHTDHQHHHVTLTTN